MNKSLYITRRYPFWRDRFLPKLLLFLFGIPKYSFGSVDVTNKCNLRCKHCYFYANPQVQELKADEMVRKITELTKKRGKVWNCTWVGGEPLLRKEIIEQLISKFKSNKIVTNGSLPLPDWKGVTFYISLDGTKEIHDQIRGKGSYEKLKNNVTSPENYGKNIRIACCLNTLNKNCIETLLEEWYHSPNVKEVLFDFMTPVESVDKSLWIPFEERDKIIDKIIALKRSRYNKFIGANEKTYYLMKKNMRHLATGKNCLFMKKGFAIDASGNIKEKCMLGPKADCDRCGCIVPFYLRSVTRKYLFL